MIRIGPFHIIPPVVARICPGPFFDVDDVVAQLFQAAAHVVFQRVYRRQHANDAKNADGDAQQGKEAAQAVALQLLKGLADAFQNNFVQCLHNTNNANEMVKIRTEGKICAVKKPNPLDESEGFIA